MLYILVITLRRRHSLYGKENLKWEINDWHFSIDIDNHVIRFSPTCIKVAISNYVTASTINDLTHKVFDVCPNGFSSNYVRRDQVFHTIAVIFNDGGKVVDIGWTMFYNSLNLNLMGDMIFSTNVYDPCYLFSARLKDTMWELMKLGRASNLADHF